MLVNIFKLLQDIGWVFDDYNDFLFWLYESKDLIDKHWEFLEEDFDKEKFVNNESLNQSLGFVVDLLRVLIKEGNA
jgi:hypothetical protein